MNLKARLIQLESRVPKPAAPDPGLPDRIAQAMERIRSRLESTDHDPKDSIVGNTVRRMVRDGHFEYSMQALRAGKAWCPVATVNYFEHRDRERCLADLQL